MDKSETTNKIKGEDASSDNALKCLLTNNIEEYFIREKGYLKLDGIQYNQEINHSNYFANVVLYNTRMRYYILVIVKNGGICHHDIREINTKLRCLAMLENGNLMNSPFAAIIGVLNDDVIIQYVTFGVKSDLFISKFHHYFPIMEGLKRMISDTLGIRQ